MLAPLLYTQKGTITSIKFNISTLIYKHLDIIYIVVLKGEKVRHFWFYKVDLPTTPTRTILFRWFRSNARFLLDRWDEKQGWVHDRDLLDATGIGGDWWDYDMISQEQAVEILTPSIGKKSAAKAILIGI